MKTRALILLSGGIDSAAALAESVVSECAQLALSIDYGQRHSTELVYAGHQAGNYGVPHRQVDLSSWGTLLHGRTSLVGNDDKPDLHGKATIVPNRNAVLLSVAASVALANACNRVVIGVHADDHAVYPDCRPEFIAAAGNMIRLATGNRVELEAPYLHWAKADIVLAAYRMRVDFVDTWSCYTPGPLHCGVCDACTGRHRAFLVAGVPDPTLYERVPTCT